MFVGVLFVGCGIYLVLAGCGGRERRKTERGEKAEVGVQ